MDREKENTKQKIKDAAIELFSKKGYDGTGMRSIAKKAGIAVSVLYYYFPNKENMYDNIVINFFDEIITGTKSFIENNSNKNLKSLILKLLYLFNDLSDKKKNILKIAIYEIQGFGKKNILRDKLIQKFKENEFIFFHLLESRYNEKSESFAASRVLFIYLTSKINDIILKNKFEEDIIKSDLKFLIK